MAGNPIADDSAARKRAALGLANKQRTRVARLKVAIKEGRVDAWALVRGEVPELEPLVSTMKARAVLLAIPGIGEPRMVQVLAVVGVSPSARMGAVSMEDRRRMADIARGALDVTTAITGG